MPIRTNEYGQPIGEPVPRWISRPVGQPLVPVNVVSDHTDRQPEVVSSPLFTRQAVSSLPSSAAGQRRSAFGDAV